MKADVLGLGLALLAAVAGAHEDEMLFPMLAGNVPSEAGFASNQVRPKQPAGQTLPLRPTRQIKFDTDEGTWLSVDIGLNDQHLVFDLLGDIYTLPATGGRATAITRGLSF